MNNYTKLQELTETRKELLHSLPKIRITDEGTYPFHAEVLEDGKIQLAKHEYMHLSKKEAQALYGMLKELFDDEENYE